MAALVPGTSLGQNPFWLQDTFVWDDLSRGLSPAAKRARYSWGINLLPIGEEPHFFTVTMDAFMEHGKFTLTISTRLLPYNYLVFSEATSMRAKEAHDLQAPALAYLEGLLGEPLARRTARRYGGRIQEWLDSVAMTTESQSHQRARGLM